MAKSVATPGPAMPAAPAKPFNSYLLNKCIIGYGVINGIINAVIFYLLHMGEPNAMLGEADIFRRQDAQPPSDEEWIGAAFDHACQPVERSAWVGIAHRLDQG